VLAVLKRRPGTLAELPTALAANPQKILKVLNDLF
jgi:hypothetical protein